MLGELRSTSGLVSTSTGCHRLVALGAFETVLYLIPSYGETGIR